MIVNTYLNEGKFFTHIHFVTYMQKNIVICLILYHKFTNLHRIFKTLILLGTDDDKYLLNNDAFPLC